jgi:hypothetical protein
MADQMDQELRRNLYHVFKIPEVFISSIFLACSVADPSHTIAVTGVSLGVYLKTLSCLLNGPSLAHYRRHRCLALCLFTRNRCRLPPPAIASLHPRSLLSTCDRSPPPAVAPLHLISFSFTYNRPPPAIIRLLTCDLSPPPAIAFLRLPRVRSLPSSCDRSPPPVIAPLHLRSLPSTYDRFPPPVIAPLHQ